MRAPSLGSVDKCPRFINLGTIKTCKKEIKLRESVDYLQPSCKESNSPLMTEEINLGRIRSFVLSRILIRVNLQSPLIWCLFKIAQV
jgi:hypothetical protein